MIEGGFLFWGICIFATMFHWPSTYHQPQPLCSSIEAWVEEEYAKGVCYPSKGEIFAAFDRCPLSKVKVVILGQDPYHGPGQAHGFSFSVNAGVKLPPSLRNIFKELEADLNEPYPITGNLEHWADQGVLLMNAVLSVRAGEAGSHRKRGWEQWTDGVIRQISNECTHVVFILWGTYAIDKTPFIETSKHLILSSPHPSPLSAYQGFFGNHHFSKSNAYLKEHGLLPIHWI